MPDQILVALITREPMRKAAPLKRLADALTAAPQFAPTGWSTTDGLPLTSFEPKAFVSHLIALKSDESTVQIARRAAVKYDGFCDLRNDGASASMRLTFGAVGAEDAVRGVFELGDRLAENTRAEFGIVHPVWPSKPGDRFPSYGGSGKFATHEYVEYGPVAVCARTWFGARLIKLIGQARLANLGAQKTDWGGMRLDLVESPWASDRQTLAARQAVVMAALKDTGVFGDYSTYPFYTRGARWR
ncbi:MAG: hypothetical protein HZB53_06285 [Chloroflexi bacterium]|nr:hypothetical protein [Chloroflexota bacterium]